MRRAAAVLLIAALALAATGCAARSRVTRPARVPIEARPDLSAADSLGARAESPPAAPANGGASRPPAEPPAAERPAPEPAERPAPTVESTMTAEQRRTTLAAIVADTTAAGAAVRRCVGRRLLPDQESVFETAFGLLEQTRAALARDELWRAESLARKARQLASSLTCPG